MKMNNIRIKYQSREYSFSSHKDNLLDIIIEAGIPIGAPCGGKGSCRKCRVKVSRGDENNIMVLACQYTVKEDILVNVPEPSEAKILTEAYWPDISLKWEKTEDLQYGVAIDIGTTTVVVYLEDLKSSRNIGTRSFLNPRSQSGGIPPAMSASPLI